MTPFHAARRFRCPETVIVLMLTTLLPNAGCRWSKRPVVNFVKGRVTLEGQPIGGVGLSLRPVVKGQGLSAFGKTLADGSYSLSSTGGGKLGAGAVAGEYYVMIDKRIDVPPDQVPPQFAPAADDPSRRVQQWFSRREWVSTDADGKKQQFVTLNLIPEAYNEAETSGLRITVKPGKNTGPAFEFDLRRDFPGATSSPGAGGR